MKNRLNKFIVLVLLILINKTVAAQPSEPGFPAALQYHLVSSNLPIVNLPFIDNEELKTVDTCKTCAKTFGVDAFAPFDFWQKSELQVITNSFETVEIYRVKVKSPTANALHIIFEHFELGPNSLIYFYSPNDTTRILGAYSMHNNKADSSFASNTIFDNEIIIEVNRRPKSSTEPKGTLKIKKFIHVFKNRDEFLDALNCNNNVICSPWYNDLCNEIRSVVKFYWHKEGLINWSMCSGAVINGGNGNFDPIILTAGHCVEGGTDHANWEFYFNFQSITCNPSTNGNDLMMIQGGNVLIKDGGLGPSCPDIALIRLRDNIPLQYNVFHSGWTRSNLSFPVDGTGIHHPAGDVKKISFGTITNPLSEQCYKVNWNNGLTEGGSSGSPLFASKQVVAVLSHGDLPICNNTNKDYYSSIRKSWNVLQPQLSPNNEEVISILGNDPITACQPIINLNRRFFPGNDWQVKNQITIQAAQQVNVANLAPTVISSSVISHFSPRHNSDYIIKAGQKISIFPGFRINVRTINPLTGISDFYDGHQNRVIFQIAPCMPFIDECGFNHQNAMIVPLKNGNINGSKDDFMTPNLSLFQFKLHPNPTSGALELKISSESTLIECMIYDKIGTLIYSIANIENPQNVIQIPIDNFADGIYFVQVKSPDGIISNQKFIKN